MLKYILLSTIITASYIGISQNTANDFFLKGKEAKTLNNNQKAIEFYTKSIEVDSMFFKSYFNRGSILAEQQKYERALHDFIIVDRLFPNFNQNLYLTGVCYYYLNKKEKALQFIEKSLSIEPLFYDSQKLKGILYLEKGNYTKSLEGLIVADRLKPNNCEISYLMAFCYEGIKQINNALNKYLHSEKLGCGNAEIYNNIGVIYFQLKNYEYAIKYFEKALITDNLNGLVYNNIGLVFYDKNDNEKALKYWNKAKGIGFKNFNSDAKILLGN